MEDFTDNLICTQCNKIKELQEKLIDLHFKLCQVTELNTTVKETMKIQETFNSFIFTFNSSIACINSEDPCVEALTEEHFSPVEAGGVTEADGKTEGNPPALTIASPAEAGEPF